MGVNPQIDNRINVNKNKINNLVRLTKFTMSYLLEQVDEGTLKHLKTPEQINEFQKQVETVLLNKLKNKFNI